MKYVIVERELVVRQTFVVGLADGRRSAEKLVEECNDDAIHIPQADELLYDGKVKYTTKEVSDELLEKLPYSKAVKAISSNYESQEQSPLIPEKRRKKSK